MQLGHEHLSKEIGCNGNHLDAETLKANNEVNREGSQGLMPLMPVADQLLSKGGKPEADGDADVENFISGNQNVGCNLAPYSLALPQFEMGKKDTEFYIDKVVTEMELPKMIVCYKEGSYHIIKDICVDEGLHSFDSILVVHNAVKDEKIYDETKFDTDDFTNELHISDGLKLSSLSGQSISDVNNEDTERASFKSVPEECEDKSLTVGEIFSSESHENFDEIVFSRQDADSHQCQGQGIHNHIESEKQNSLESLLEEDRENTNIAEEIVHASETKELLPMQLDRGHFYDFSCSESNLDQPQLVSSDMDQPLSVCADTIESQFTKGDSHQLKSVSGDCANLSSMSGSIAQQSSVYDGRNRDQVDEGALDEAKSTTSGVSSKEIKGENKSKDLPGVGDSGSNSVAVDINCELPPAVAMKDVKGISENQQSGLVTSGSMMEDTSSDGPSASSRSSLNPGHADTNFLGSASLSGQIAYSGQIPYSGSISLRSDSSTTSTRSFAFPILQSEWNSSPVKMAKADRRHFRKSQGWRSGLLCCRF
uniref:Uncharacterized protein n=1 Tax=Anthurium amnicola TaxID=1678845 RepID=A0A1D1YBG2_9ARAE